MGTFDNRTNQEILRIKEKIKAQGIPVDAYEPHITFGIYTELEEAVLLEWIGEVSANLRSIQLCFNHFGFFPDTRLCFLAPCASYDLLALHTAIHQKYDSCCTDKGCLYSLNQKNWTPHMTVAAVEPGQEEKLLSTIWGSFCPLTAQLVHLKITSSDTNKIVGMFDLKACDEA